MTSPTPEPGSDAGSAAGPGQGQEQGPEGGPRGGADDENQGPVVRDRRRLDPLTGKVRAAYASAGSGTATATAEAPEPVSDVDGSGDAGQANELANAQLLAEERLADLQRLNAEYVNYRKRVDRDRDLARDSAVAAVLEALLPVLDDVHLARQHGDLESGPFAAIAEKLDATLQRFGLARYGEVGEAFDPTVHEALMHTSAELAAGTTTTTVVQVLQPGYRAGDRVLRAARVAVADPVG